MQNIETERRWLLELKSCRSFLSLTSSGYCFQLLEVTTNDVSYRRIHSIPVPTEKYIYWEWKINQDQFTSEFIIVFHVSFMGPV